MEEIIIHMIIIAPLTKWLIGPNRSWNKGKREYGVYIALLLLFCVGIYELRKTNQNLYEVLQLNAYASKTDIQQSFRRLSRVYHPDKNKEADSFERFNKIREAYEILSNEKKKYIYDRFGDFAGSEITNFFYVEIIIIAIFQFAISFIFGFLYTYGKDNEKYRILICLYIALNFCIELVFRFSPESTHFLSFLPIFCHYTPFERIHSLRVLVPLVMNAILLLDVYFIDEDTDLYVSTFCEYVFENSQKTIKNMDDVVIFCARLVDGKVNKANNFSWREKDPYSDLANIEELEDEETYDKKCDKSDMFYKLLYNVVETSTEDVELKIPKKSLCRRFDWSRLYTESVMEKNTEEKDFEQSNASKGILFSSLLYFIGLISHLVSK
ncbi:DNAJ, putative [Plasmodium knowlesi strain H]|uniref:DNAJ, putative n=3 Tax=Plasmodium knowlesi TaxID=5850 RepID=A0A5K1VKV6_PLAKH|nr:DnaJ protein, putative [Plasmodium knowlesi strain H]OTN67654.1 putative DNAJ [Plasmodium knowlesi]CAA9990469.1 DnaJ protein, putative [Plasmodium knowlesi strain H]SBO19679.1 DNAJ, putative [Plasmodium knowlesi strain H]SBO22494.1 DNAJ, putative [Plasmodium knowlesi strain H]VVS79943.1 DnaJ protein, putative [Plasmodium knowlesi strain H]|eukprot:XP_002260858.1 DNAJ, putative [Plasmodium knowlesi strain H]